MSKKFEEKSAKVVIVDKNAPVRQLMSESVRAVGFENVSTQSSITDMLNYLETETADWIIVSLMPDQPVNALHLLKIISETPSLKEIRVTLAVDADEKYVLPKAFELGLMSTIDKPFTKDTLPGEIEDLIAIMKKQDWNHSFIAAYFLRLALAENPNITPKDILVFEESMVQTFPGITRQLLNLAEASAKADEPDQAKALISQIKIINPELEEAADELAATLFGDEGLGELTSKTAFNTLGISSVVIIDPDETNATAAKEIFEEIGVENVLIFEDGESAWKSLDSNDEPDIIVCEWRIPKINGPMLIQKIRSKGFHNVPIVCLSSLIKPADMPLVKEMSVSNIIAKPIRKEDFLTSIIWTIQQDRSPSETNSLERKIRAAISTNDQTTIDSLLPEFLGSDKTPLARKRTIEAEIAYHNKDYINARNIGIDALKQTGDSVIILNLLGKTFMHLHDYKGSLSCFQKAQELSPHNIDRLCNIAESQMELGDEEAAAETLEDAGMLDPDSEKVTEAKIKVALAGKDTETARAVMQNLQSLSNIISYMNNKAVAHAKCGFANDAIELYKNTLDSIPDENSDMQNVVRYNLVLAMVRENHFEEALEALEEVIKDKKNKVYKKALSLKERLQESINKGEGFALRSTTVEINEADKKDSDKDESNSPLLNSDADYASMLAVVGAKKGDLCCFMIYNLTSEDPAVNDLLKKQPRFTKRSAIERDETFGTEAANKSANKTA